MPRRFRDRHGRGIRGPLAAANPYLPRPVTPPRQPTRAELFHEAVTDAMGKLAGNVPELWREVEVGVEDVPSLLPLSGEIPLAAATAATPDRAARVVVYRRPIEARSDSPEALRELVLDTLVQQVAAVSAHTTAELDPDAE